MHFTEEEIQRIGESMTGRMRKANAALSDKEIPNLAALQAWMKKNKLDSPEIVEIYLKKAGAGQKAGKKNLSEM